MTGNPEDKPPESQTGQEFERLIGEHSHLAPPSEGEVLQGHVLKITPQGVIVDVGLKLEGLVPLQQLTGPDGQITVRPGDAIEAMIDRRRCDVEGYIQLSYERAHRSLAWENLERAFNENLLISGRVVGRVKGGLSVDVGVLAFMPGTQVDVRPPYNLDAFVGQDIPVRVVKLNRRRDNVVVSRKAAIEEENQSRKAALLASIHEGDLVTGVVKSITDYGAFVDLGGIDGLLHVGDLSHGRVAHPQQVLHVGQEVTVRVLKYDREKERISLGLKQAVADPWENVGEHYVPGTRVVGRVMSVADYGAFVELEPGVEGLIHISEMTWSRRMKHPAKLVRVGDSVEAVVLEVKSDERRISLGIKQLEADPWTTVDQRYSVGSVVEGRVRKITEFGAFIEIEEGIDGLVHISDLSWTKRVQHPSELLKKGQVVQAVILNIDAPNRRLSLGVKQLLPDSWETFFREHVVGDIVTGSAIRNVAFGTFIELAPGVEGLCHNSEIPADVKQPSGLPLGSDYHFRIIKIQEADHRIGLSLVSPADQRETQRLSDYQRQAARVTQAIDGVMQPETQKAPAKPERPGETESPDPGEAVDSPDSPPGTGALQ